MAEKRYFDEESLASAMSIAPMAYSPTEDDDNRGGIQSGSTAFLTLALEEFHCPKGGEVRDRILEHLRNLIAGGNEPRFEVLPYWSYVPVTAGIALAKKTPSVWGELTADEIERLDLIMRAHAIISCYGTDDDNFFRTGPGLHGNYCKGWNPNYRFANVGPIIFSTLYFGSSEIVNGFFMNFDYDEIIAEFRRFGFTRAEACWTTETHEAKDEEGNPVLDESGKPIIVLGGRDLLTKGGNAYAYDRRYKGKLTEAGYGIGVKGNTYTYMGHTLDELPEIFNKLLLCNYGGGVSRDEQYNEDKSIKIGWTDHENAEKMGAGPNPMLGREGMMRELGLPSRSSVGYSAHDFMLVMSIMDTMRALGAYDPNEYPEIYRMMIVGNEDFLYKCKVGYFSGVNVWYTGGQWRITRSDESAFGVTYWMWKYVWRNYYLNDPDAVAGA